MGVVQAMDDERSCSRTGTGMCLLRMTHYCAVRCTVCTGVHQRCGYCTSFQIRLLRVLCTTGQDCRTVWHVVSLVTCCFSRPGTWHTKLATAPGSTAA